MYTPVNPSFAIYKSGVQGGVNITCNPDVLHKLVKAAAWAYDRISNEHLFLSNVDKINSSACVEP